MAEIPASLEVEELTVRVSDDGSYLTIRGGEDGNVAWLAWYNSDGEFVGQIYGGSVNGIVLDTINSDLTTWTRMCIDEGEISLCPLQESTQ